MNGHASDRMTKPGPHERNVFVYVALRAVASSELEREQLSTLRSKDINACAVDRVDSCSLSEPMSTDLAFVAQPGNLTAHCCARRPKHRAALSIVRCGGAEFGR